MIARMIECNSTHPPEDDPYFKPLEIKRMKILIPPSNDPNNFAQLRGKASETRKKDGKTDIFIKFGSKKFKVHKRVMKESSELFKKMPAFVYSRPLQTYNMTSARFLPEGCKVDTIKKIINFAYTGHLPNFPANDFLEFFTAAVALQFHEALQVYCQQFSRLYKGAFRTVSTKVAAILLSQAQKIRKPYHLSKCAEFLGPLFSNTCEYLLKEPLENLTCHKDFLKYLSAGALELFLDRDDLAKPEEENKVLELVLAWVRYDQQNRKVHAKKLLKKVHLGLLSRDRLSNLLSQMTRLSEECKKLVKKVLRLMDSKDDVPIPLEYTHYQWFGTRSEMFCDTLIAICPGGQALAYFNTHGPKRSQGWRNWCDYERRQDKCRSWRWNSSVLSVSGKLYLAGGGHHKQDQMPDHLYDYDPSFCCYDRYNHSQVYEGNVRAKGWQIEERGGYVCTESVNPWSQYPPMKDSRRSFPMVHLDDYLYAIGGEDHVHVGGELHGNRAIKEAERFSFKDKRWEKIADLPVPCYYACATVYKGKILVYGSQAIRDPDTPAQHNLQMYDPATNQWENLLTEQHVIAKYKRDNIPEDSDSTKKKDKKRKEGGTNGEDTGDGTDDEEGNTSDGEDNKETEDVCGWEYHDKYKHLYEKEAEIGKLFPKNALVVDGEECYRVVYTPNRATPNSDVGAIKLEPVVHKLDFDFSGSKPSVEIGEPQCQDLMPQTLEGAFQIHNRVYINMRGCVRNTGIRINARHTRKGEVDLGIWDKLFERKEWFEDNDVQFANFKFDKKTCFCGRCVRGQSCICDEGSESESECESESDSESDSDWSTDSQGAENCVVS